LYSARGAGGTGDDITDEYDEEYGYEFREGAEKLEDESF
jgi:hypothetical protein